MLLAFQLGVIQNLVCSFLKFHKGDLVLGDAYENWGLLEVR